MSKLKVKARKPKRSQRLIKLSEISAKFDIQVEGKFERVVMISANSKARKIVEGLWPDVEWSEFDAHNSADWLFTHVRVTRLPPHFTAKVSLVDAIPDSLGFAVAWALHRRGWPLRVAYYTGQDEELTINSFGSPPATRQDADLDLALYADYVPPTRSRRGLH